MCQKYTAGLIDQQTKSAFHLRRHYISEHAQEPPIMPPVYSD